MRTVLAAILALHSTSTLAWNFCSDALMPPLEFQGEPEVKYKIIELPREMISSVCGYSWVPWQELGGCASEEVPGVWWLRIRDDFTPSERECVLLHEKAHVRGWAHDDAATKAAITGPLYRRVFDPYKPSEFISD